MGREISPELVAVEDYDYDRLFDRDRRVVVVVASWSSVLPLWLS